MNPAEQVCELQYFDGSTRQVRLLDEDLPFPEGRLIVSRTDLQGRITHCNSAFVAMSGYSEAELIGQPHSILRHPDMPAAAFADLWQTVQSGEKWHGYVKNLRKDGRYYWVFAVVIPNIRDGLVVSYTSVRRKPAQRRVDEVVTLYRQMKAAEAGV